MHSVFLQYVFCLFKNTLTKGLHGPFERGSNDMNSWERSHDLTFTNLLFSQASRLLNRHARPPLTFLFNQQDGVILATIGTFCSGLWATNAEVFNRTWAHFPAVFASITPGILTRKHNHFLTLNKGLNLTRPEQSLKTERSSWNVKITQSLYISIARIKWFGWKSSGFDLLNNFVTFAHLSGTTRAALPPRTVVLPGLGKSSPRQRTRSSPRRSLSAPHHQ